MTNSEDFRKWGRDMVDYVAGYLDTIDKRPPLAQVSPGYLRQLIPTEAPQKPDNWEDVMADLERVIMPGVTHWHSPHFHSYFPTGNSFAAILGDILSDAIGCVGFTWVSSPACTELETVVMDWLGKMLGLPDSFLAAEGEGKGGGVIQGTASEATVMAILAAKMKSIRCIQQEQPEKDQYEIMSKLVAYCSEQSHSSVERAALIASVRMRLLPTDEKNALRGETLRKVIEEDKAKGLIPTFVCATMGTTGCCSFDNIEELGTICNDEDMWLHVDAAYAGSALICPEYRYLAAGMELADSFNFNAHKWLRVNFDCSCMWVKNQQDLVGAFHVDPTYLKHEHQGQVIDYRHWHIPLGRRFRSLKIWFVLRLFGIEKLQEHIKTQVALAHEFEALVLADDRFEISADVVLGLVCFHLKASDEKNQNLLDQINKTGKVFMVGAMLNGQFILRFAVCAATTTSEHVQYAWGIIQDETNKLLSEQNCNGSLQNDKEG